MMTPLEFFITGVVGFAAGYVVRAMKAALGPSELDPIESSPIKAVEIEVPEERDVVKWLWTRAADGDEGFGCPKCGWISLPGHKHNGAIWDQPRYCTCSKRDSGHYHFVCGHCEYPAIMEPGSYDIHYKPPPPKPAPKSPPELKPIKGGK